MYLPIVFGYEVYNDIPVFLGFFYKFIDCCLKYNWPIITQKNYFESFENIENKYNYKIFNALKYHGVTSLENDFINKVDKYIIPDKITKKIVEKSGSVDEAWVNIMKDGFTCLEEYLEKTIDEIKKNYKKEIKAVLLWRHNESVSKVCKKLGIKTIEMEFTTFRYPFYNELISYFQYSNKYSTQEFNDRYEKFLSEDTSKLPILYRKEILALFLDKENISYINKLNDPIAFDIGVALGLEKDYESKATGCMCNSKIIKYFKKYYSNNQTLYKVHPSGKYVFSQKVNIDDSCSSADFVLRCRRVASVLSNIGYEAMLYGRTSYVMGDMPFANCGADSKKIDDEVLDLKHLNYITFAYFAPYDLMLDKEYLDWRDSNPSESEIYMRHLNYYLAKRNIDISIFNVQGIERLKEILKIMGYKNFNELVDTKTDDYVLKFKRSVNKELILTDQIKELKSIINQKDKELSNISNEINKIINSSSWRLTKPLRNIKKKISKKEEK